MKTAKQLEENGIYIENYVNGFIIAVYIDNDARYYGSDLIGQRQPIINNPFNSYEGALNKAQKLII